ncbi:MAG: phosphoenolpyruvate carboxykinase [Ancalomicrobiaceae bacterium]|nr:phosphoenolpyruvate carboxykinase [Ancalomicrobiaceae bacterium]
MQQTGLPNKSQGIASLGLTNLAAIHWNLQEPNLYEQAVRRGEGTVAAGGALSVDTGNHTGRSPRDKFIVRDALTERSVWWDNNKPISADDFDRLHADFAAAAVGKELFVQDLLAGADRKHRLKTRVITEYAWHALLVRDLLIHPAIEELENFIPDLTIIDLPSFKADPVSYGIRSDTVIACDFSRRLILIGGTAYAGEIKKSIFTLLNYLLPARGVLPMHSSANVGPDGDVALFLGVSGTGKTTLAADPHRTLIGNDAHGWSHDGIFNIEGGSYVRTSHLSRETEPEIFSPTERFGTVLENVSLNPLTREPDFDDGRRTDNSRAAYPLSFFPNASTTGRAGQPKTIFLLTADAFSVLPPIARLTPAQAMYHYLSGYSAKVPGPEEGVAALAATFSTCYAASFMPRHPSDYGELLRRLVIANEVDCWLVNTGWTGGPFGTGRRMPLAVTRRLVAAALDGSLKAGGFYVDRFFGFEVPSDVAGVETDLLHPRRTWADKVAYDAQAATLAQMFSKNFEKFEALVDGSVRGAAPHLTAAAE